MQCYIARLPELRQDTLRLKRYYRCRRECAYSGKPDLDIARNTWNMIHMRKKDLPPAGLAGRLGCGM